MNLKKGFTVYELAIVFIVIGLVMGLVLKVTSIVDIAKLKRECAKFENMRSAITIYYKIYKQLPGAGSDTGITILANSKAAEAALVDAALLDDNDFISSINPAADANYRYYFTRCLPDNGQFSIVPGDPNVRHYSFVFYPLDNKQVAPDRSIPTGSVCVGAYNPAVPVTMGFEGFKSTTPQRLRAAFELYFDDRRIDNGYGRRAHNNNGSLGNDTFTEDEYKNGDEIAFLHEQIKGTEFIGSGNPTDPNDRDTPNRANDAYFIKIY
jgi:hypothetical protein